VVTNAVNGKVLAVNVTDADHYPESPCKLAVGEHAVITKPSVIKYPEAVEIPERGMSIALGLGVAVRHCPDLHPEVLARVIAGIAMCGDMDPLLKRRYGLGHVKQHKVHITEDS
jgi:hypothetical protein